MQYEMKSLKHCQSYLTLWNPTDCSTLGLPVPHHPQSLPKFVFIASMMSYSLLILWSPLLLPLIFPSIRDFSSELPVRIRWTNARVSASVSVLPLNIQGWWSPLRLTGLISLLPKGLSRIFPITTVWRDQFSGILPSIFCPALTTIHDHWEDHSLDYMDLCQQSNVSAF